jgi:DNA primase catalytic core
MARIREDEIERLKEETSVARLVEAAGVELKRQGADLVGRCPFHEDKTPSLVITPSKNLWHCLGACRAGGSVIDWMMKAQGVSFRHAVELLKAGQVPASAQPVKRSTVRKLEAPVAPDADDRAALLQVVAYYHEQLKESPEALGYLEKRGLRAAEMVERFKLGFANRTLGYRLPEKNRKAGEELRGRLARLGILRESGHEHFAGSLVIPIFDEAGQVVGMYGRKVTAHLRDGTPLHLYLPGPHRGVWNVEALQAQKEVILCEALIDALTFWCAGYRNVTASYGVEGFTAQHLAAFKRYGTEHVLIAYDRDEAGDGAAEELAKTLVAEGIGCSRVQFPKGMDANEYALKVQPAAKALGLCMQSARWIGGPKRTIAEEMLVSVAPEPTPTPRSPAVAVMVEVKEEPISPEVTPAKAPSEKERLVPPPPPVVAEARPETPHPSLAAALPVATDVPAEVSEEEITLQLGDRRYRVRGFGKNLSYDQLRINLLCARGGGFHVDTLDLYSSRQRAAFIKQASVELSMSEEGMKKDLGQVLRKLEELQEAQIKKATTPQAREVVLSAEEIAEAMRLLTDPRLLERILTDFERCGVVGEETNKLMGYLAVVSRKLDEPLAVIIQSSSAAGKTSLMEAVLAFVPEEDRVKYSAMTGQSLFYLGEQDLKHKILAVVEEEGAKRASYALKLLQSEGELTIASTGKDPETGRLVTREYRVEGPVMIFLTTTAIEIDEELMNRCVVLTVNEEREQTRAIHRLQRERQTLEGLLARVDRERTLALHRNAQRLLRPLMVVNPYARELTFLDDRTRTRRDHLKYLALIRASALLHQHQRPRKTVAHRGEAVEYIEAELEDLDVANRLSHQVLGRSLDELPPQTRRVLLLLDQMVTKACEEQKLARSDYRFSRREVREYAVGISDFQVRTHLAKLVELEYLLVHRGGRGQSFVYELIYDGQGKDGAPFLTGLLDLAQLKKEAPAEEIEEAPRRTSTSAPSGIVLAAAARA